MRQADRDRQLIAARAQIADIGLGRHILGPQALDDGRRPFHRDAHQTAGGSRQTDIHISCRCAQCKRYALQRLRDGGNHRYLHLQFGRLHLQRLVLDGNLQGEHLIFTETGQVNFQTVIKIHFVQEILCAVHIHLFYTLRDGGYREACCRLAGPLDLQGH
ncbi:hypothetical protein D3C76_1415380 [compost metagenome]